MTRYFIHVIINNYKGSDIREPTQRIGNLDVLLCKPADSADRTLSGAKRHCKGEAHAGVSGNRFHVAEADGNNSRYTAAADQAERHFALHG